MKFKFIGIFLLITLSCKTGFSQWYNEKFQIGTFADPRVSRDNNKTKDSISFNLAKAAHFNLLTGPQYYNGGAGFDLMDKTLDLAAKYNMHLLVIDSKLSVTNDNFSDNDAQRIISHFKNVDGRKRSAIGGYYFGGEFPQAKAGQVKKWAGYFKDNDPEKPTFVYLLPSYGFNSHEAYEQYLDSYLKDEQSDKKPQIVGYDYYPFLSPAIMSSYFYNLGIIKEKADGRPVWYYIQSTTKKNLPDITDYQMKFMAFCPLAYGSKGAIYYTYESIPDSYGLNYHDAIINPYGNVTKKYWTVKSINLYLANVAGPVVMANTCVGAYHSSGRNAGENIPSRDILGRGNRYIKSVNNPNILVGIFKKGQSGTYYLMLINKSSNNINGLTVTIPGSRSVSVLPGSTDYKGSTDKSPLAVNKGRNATSFNLTNIGGGEMAVVEVN